MYNTVELEENRLLNVNEETFGFVREIFVTHGRDTYKKNTVYTILDT